MSRLRSLLGLIGGLMTGPGMEHLPHRAARLARPVRRLSGSSATRREKDRRRTKVAEREKQEFLAAQNERLIRETAERMRKAGKELPGYLSRRLERKRKKAA